VNPTGARNRTVDNLIRSDQFSGIHVIEVVEIFEEQETDH